MVTFLGVLWSLRGFGRLIAGPIVSLGRFCSLKLDLLIFHEKDEKHTFKSHCASCCRRRHDHGADDGDHACVAGKCGSIARIAGEDARRPGRLSGMRSSARSRRNCVKLFRSREDAQLLKKLRRHRHHAFSQCRSLRRSRTRRSLRA